MTAVCITFILVDKIGFGLPQEYTPWIAGASALFAFPGFYYWNYRKNRK